MSPNEGQFSIRCVFNDEHWYCSSHAEAHFNHYSFECIDFYCFALNAQGFGLAKIESPIPAILRFQHFKLNACCALSIHAHSVCKWRDDDDNVCIEMRSNGPKPNEVFSVCVCAYKLSLGRTKKLWLYVVITFRTFEIIT